MVPLYRRLMDALYLVCVLIAGLAVVVSFGWRSRGDLERYLKMRRM